MCGISLIFHNNGLKPKASAIESMVKAMLHRGPDEQTSDVQGCAALGHARLSIVDIAGGKQPMQSADGRFHIIFNGEIYNYQELREQLVSKGIRFSTHSDTEVILQLFCSEGVDSVNRLRGMFSFIIYDGQEQSVYMFRDRLGIKPLFYHYSNHTLVAASEMKCLFASKIVQAEWDPNTIISHFTYQFSVQQHTIFKGIKQLPAGHFMVLKQNSEPVIREYWDVQFPKEGEYESLDEEYWTERFSQALQDSARCHTIGEVPIGSYLSGGVDSATTTWLLGQNYDKDINSFSVHFNNENLDESQAYKSIAKHLHTENIELPMDDNSETGYVDIMEQALYFLEQPQRMAMDVPFFLLSKLVREHQHKVIYSGEGADEILAGYDCYRQDYMRLWGNEIKDEQLRQLLYFTQFTQNFAPQQVQSLFHNHNNQKDVIDQFACYPVWYDFWSITDDMLPDLFQADFKQQYQDPMLEAAEIMRPHLAGRHRINQSLYIETKTRLPNWILWRSDRMSMAHSVEARVPFLDHPLVELAAAIPPDLKLNGMNEKYLLKKISLPHLPQSPWQYKKRAFYTPIQAWFFRPDILSRLDPYLSTEAINDAGIFNAKKVKEIINLLLNSQACNADEYYMLMKWEWITMLVLSMQILHQQFILKKAPCFH